MYLLITIDTEGDNAWSDHSVKSSTRNARYLPRFQELCDHFGFKPTYLTSYEMAKDEFFGEFAADAIKKGTCEVGLHPHPWNSPPEYKLTSDDLANKPYMIEYPEAIIREKVKVLTDLLQERFGVKMVSHRAGRWAFDATYARILSEFGYKVDCSITPYVKDIAPSHSDSDPVKVPLPDYSTFPAKPYFLDEEDISRPGQLGILEIPVTIIPNYGRIRSTIYELFPQGACRRLFRGIFGAPVKWFRPTKRRPRYLMQVATEKVRAHSDYIMFMIHSSELAPGCNPQFQNEKEIDLLYRNMHETFQWLFQHDVEAATCQEFYNAFMGTTR